jgi:hypothetical protein
MAIENEEKWDRVMVRVAGAIARGRTARCTPRMRLLLAFRWSRSRGVRVGLWTAGCAWTGVPGAAA